mgnify:CR=1 FL=1
MTLDEPEPTGIGPDSSPAPTRAVWGVFLAAVAVAAALSCPCDIYTDVDGVYTTDPRIENRARRLANGAEPTVPVDNDKVTVIALREKVIAGKVPMIKQQSDLFKDSLGHGKAALQTMVVYCNYAVAYRRSPVGLPVPPAMKKARSVFCMSIE